MSDVTITRVLNGQCERCKAEGPVAGLVEKDLLVEDETQILCRTCLIEEVTTLFAEGFDEAWADLDEGE